MGQDEGQMGFIDALHAGVETIVTPQGYHLDACNGISYSFNTYDELLKVFNEIKQKREKLINAVSTWNWYDYARKHADIWNYLISKEKGTKETFKASVESIDGLNSVMEFDQNRVRHTNYSKRIIKRGNLIAGDIKHKYHIYKITFKTIIRKYGFWGTLKAGLYKIFRIKHE